ncbi:MAG: hypothetical protein L0Y64_06445 [Myxococcaceae bacterium]|nr:hypothetical protein [Myxococcaceae bacterium]
MNRILPWSAVVLSLAAMAVSLRGRGDATVPAASELRDIPTSHELDALERRVGDLEATALSLSQRASALERGRVVPAGGGPTVAAGSDAPALTQQVEQLRAEVQSLMAGELMDDPQGREQFKHAVRTAQDELVAERMQARMRASAEVRKARLERFFSEARLGSSQQQELTKLLDAEEQRRDALFEEARGGGKTPRDARQELRVVREETDSAAARLLDESQRAQYEEMRREDWQGRREQRPRADDRER